MSKAEEREFRLRPRKPSIPRSRSERLAWATAFKTISHFARASRVMKSSGAERNGGKRTSVPRNQRCAVRVTYARNAVHGQWRAHGRYLARESATTEPAAAVFDRSESAIDVAARLDTWQAARDQRIWKVIISPEFGERVDLPRLTRDLMERVEKDLGTPLEWVAVAHFNTEHPHVHVALRGVAQDGQEVRLPREFVRSGIRSIAEDLCTRQLGHRTEMDAAEAERREVHEKRFTSLDRIILRRSVPSGGSNTVSISMDGRPHLIARLSVLEDMGLARASGAGEWEIRPDLESVLRSMQRVADRQRTLRAHGVPMSDERLPIEVYDFRRTPLVEGRLLVHGEDEQSGRGYLMLEGIDARVHYIEYTPEIEEARARGELRPNAFARLRRLGDAVYIEDLGDAEVLLKNGDYFAKKSHAMVRKPSLSAKTPVCGWLGRYQRALQQAATELQERQTSSLPKARVHSPSR